MLTILSYACPIYASCQLHRSQQHAHKQYYVNMHHTATLTIPLHPPYCSQCFVSGHHASCTEKACHARSQYKSTQTIMISIMPVKRLTLCKSIHATRNSLEQYHSQPVNLPRFPPENPVHGVVESKGHSAVSAKLGTSLF